MMKSTTLLRTVWTAALFATGSSITAFADPVVLSNGSYIEGDASIGLGAERLSGFYATWNDGRLLPTSGVGSFTDGLTLTANGAVITPSSRLTTSISPMTLSASGGADAEIAGDPSLATRGSAISQLVIEFLISEPHSYTYSAQYSSGTENVISETNGKSHAMGGTLYQLVELEPNTTGSVRYFFDSFFSAASTQHSGILEPGHYFLQAYSSVRLDTPDTRDSAGYAVNLALAPQPIPEPATVVLVGLGGAVAIGRARLGRRGPTATAGPSRADR